MIWFKKEAATFRQRFFAEHRVSCLANFANLAYVLFAGRSHIAASAIVYEKRPPEDGHTIWSFAPFVAEQVANRPIKKRSKLVTWNIVVDNTQVREIDNMAAQSGNSVTWKLAMWGTSRDRKLLDRLDARFKDESFDSLKRVGIIGPHEGLQLRTRSSENDEAVEHHPELIGKLKVHFERLRNVGHLFHFPDFVLGRIGDDECYVRKGRAKLPITVSTPPHIVVDASRRFAVYSDEFIAVPARQIGISGDSKKSRNWLRALSLYLSSDFCVYHQFLKSPQRGIDMNRADLHALVQMPMPLRLLSPSELTEWIEIHQQLISQSKRRFSAGHKSNNDDNAMQQLLDELNDRVFNLLGLKAAERWLVEDFVRIQLNLTHGKVTREVRRAPTALEINEYLSALCDCLNGFLTTNRRLKHKVEALTGGDSAFLSVSLVQSDEAIAPAMHTADEPTANNLQVIRNELRSKHSQWVYFDRGLKIYEPLRGTLYQFKPMQRLHWTRRQAVLDADEIIAETLVKGEK